jgi:hypothetical protein
MIMLGNNILHIYKRGKQKLSIKDLSSIFIKLIKETVVLKEMDISKRMENFHVKVKADGCSYRK